MCSEVVVTLLISRVFGDEVQVLSANNEGTVHFGRDDGAGENSSADGDFAGERAFLV